MKRVLVFSVLSLAATFLFTSLAVGQASTGTTKSKTSSKVAPQRDRVAPYKFKVEGEVDYPDKFCKFGDRKANRDDDDDDDNRLDNCIPLQCPPGATTRRYCSKPDDEAICTGDVVITFKNLAGATVATQTVPLEFDDEDDECGYEARFTIVPPGRMTVTVDFLGNEILAPSSAKPKSARAG